METRLPQGHKMFIEWASGRYGSKYAEECKRRLQGVENPNFESGFPILKQIFDEERRNRMKAKLPA